MSCLDSETNCRGAATATRDLPGMLELGANFDFSFEVSACGFTGQVMETLPAGFTYAVDGCSDLGIEVEVEGSELRFTFLGDTATFTYNVASPTVASPALEDAYPLTGVVLNEDRPQSPIGGDSKTTIGGPRS